VSWRPSVSSLPNIFGLERKLGPPSSAVASLDVPPLASTAGRGSCSSRSWNSRNLIEGKVSSCFAALVRASPVYALEKGNGRVRPIEPESVWAKLASHVALVPKTFLSMEELQGRQRRCAASSPRASASPSWMLPTRLTAFPAWLLRASSRPAGTGGGDPFVLPLTTRPRGRMPHRRTAAQRRTARSPGFCEDFAEAAFPRAQRRLQLLANMVSIRQQSAPNAPRGLDAQPHCQLR
jgi:hypothetical protein